MDDWGTLLFPRKNRRPWQRQIISIYEFAGEKTVAEEELEIDETTTMEND